MRAPRFGRRLVRSIQSGPLTVFRAISSAVEHFVDIEGVTGSIPVSPTKPYFSQEKCRQAQGRRASGGPESQARNGHDIFTGLRPLRAQTETRRT